MGKETNRGSRPTIHFKENNHKELKSLT